MQYAHNYDTYQQEAPDPSEVHNVQAPLAAPYIGEASLHGVGIEYPSDEVEQAAPHAEADDPISPVEGLKNRNYARLAPVFSEQLQDGSRTNEIEYVSGQRMYMGTGTNSLAYEHQYETFTEHDSINALDVFLEEVARKSDADPAIAERAVSMREKLSFIGKQEYEEATAGIAAYWKDMLRSDPKNQLLAVTGRIDMSMIKSDAYLLDNILKNFSDEELEEFEGRLVTDANALTADPENVSVILLDDWSISGMQMREAAYDFADDHPNYRDRMEIQLLAAPSKRIREGLDVHFEADAWKPSESKAIPVKAYYKAHDAHEGAYTQSGAHITGAHCAVDFDFNNDIAQMASGIGKDMPPATNIVRPYRKPGVVLDQVHRIKGNQKPTWERAKVYPDKTYDDSLSDGGISVMM